jgi:hypothetical protein
VLSNIPEVYDAFVIVQHISAKCDNAIYPDFLTTSEIFVVLPQVHEWFAMRVTRNRISIAVIAIDGTFYGISSPMHE